MTNIDTQMAEVKKDISWIKKEFAEFKGDLKDFRKEIQKFMECADKKYARQEQFLFWRNVLFLSIIVTLFVAIVLGVINKAIF